MTNINSSKINEKAMEDGTTTYWFKQSLTEKNCAKVKEITRRGFKSKEDAEYARQQVLEEFKTKQKNGVRRMKRINPAKINKKVMGDGTVTYWFKQYLGTTENGRKTNEITRRGFKSKEDAEHARQELILNQLTGEL